MWTRHNVRSSQCIFVKAIHVVLHFDRSSGLGGRAKMAQSTPGTTDTSQTTMRLSFAGGRMPDGRGNARRMKSAIWG